MCENSNPVLFRTGGYVKAPCNVLCLAAQRVFCMGRCLARCCFPRLLHIVLYDVCCSSSSNYHVYCCVLDPLAVLLARYYVFFGFRFLFLFLVVPGGEREARSTTTARVLLPGSIVAGALHLLWSSLLSSCFLALSFPFCRCELQAAAASSSSSSSFGFFFCFIAFVLEQVLELFFGASARK